MRMTAIALTAILAATSVDARIRPVKKPSVPASIEATLPGPVSEYGPGPKDFATGIHNCGQGCADEAALVLDRLQPRWVRVGVANNVYGTVEEMRMDPMMLELQQRGIKVMYTINGTDAERVDPAVTMERLRKTMAAYPQVEYIQLLNEPVNMNDMDPVSYVRDIIKPGRALIDAENTERAKSNLPPIKLVSTGFYGLDRGVEQTRAALAAGMGRYIDILGVHLYAENSVDNAKRYRDMASSLPIFVTEYGENSFANHEQWYFEVGAQIEKAIGGPTFTDRRGVTHEQPLLWYVLAGDREFRLVDYWREEDGTLKHKYTSPLGDKLEIRPR
jgi:hypothetical protein